MYQHASVARIFPIFVLLLVVLPDPFRGIRGMAEDHGAPEAARFSRAWNRGCRVKQSRQGARRESVTGQCRMR